MALQAAGELEELPHPVSRRLQLLLDELTSMTTDALGGVDDESSEADLIDQVALLERLRGAVSAAQAATVVRFARARVERQLALDVHPRDVSRGIARRSGWRAGSHPPSQRGACRRRGHGGSTCRRRTRPSPLDR